MRRLTGCLVVKALTSSIADKRTMLRWTSSRDPVGSSLSIKDEIRSVYYFTFFHVLLCTSWIKEQIKCQRHKEIVIIRRRPEEVLRAFLYMETACADYSGRMTFRHLEISFLTFFRVYTRLCEFFSMPSGCLNNDRRGFTFAIHCWRTDSPFPSNIINNSFQRDRSVCRR